MSALRTGRLEANGLSFVIDEMGEGDAVALCLHGFPESRFSWRHQLPLLAGLGWRAIAPDLRGYGHSSRPPAKADYRMEHLVEDVAGMFEAAGARRRLIVSHDWGAMIAWFFAMQNRLPLDGLVIMNVPHPAVFERVWRTTWKQKLNSWYVAFFQIPGLPEAMLRSRNGQPIADAFVRMAIDKSRFPKAVTDVYRENALIPGALTAMINYYRANGDMLGRFQGQPPMIETPTLIIWGEDDDAISIEATKGYEPYVKDLTLHTLPRVSHWVQQEAPEKTNEYLEAWLRERGLANPA